MTEAATHRCLSFTDAISLTKRPRMSAPVLAYEGLGLVQGSGWLFRDLDIYIGERDRLALIGRNGAGKTTLLKLLADRIEADQGRRTIVPGTPQAATPASSVTSVKRQAPSLRSSRLAPYAPP